VYMVVNHLQNYEVVQSPLEPIDDDCQTTPIFEPVLRVVGQLS